LPSSNKKIKTKKMYDIVIRNGMVVDGTGKEKYLADVAIKNGKIAKIGKINWSRGRKEIDAEGKIVERTVVFFVV